MPVTPFKELEELGISAEEYRRLLDDTAQCAGCRQVVSAIEVTRWSAPGMTVEYCARCERAVLAALDVLRATLRGTADLQSGGSEQ